MSRVRYPDRCSWSAVLRAVQPVAIPNRDESGISRTSGVDTPARREARTSKLPMAVSARLEWTVTWWRRAECRTRWTNSAQRRAVDRTIHTLMVGSSRSTRVATSHYRVAMVASAGEARRSREPGEGVAGTECVGGCPGAPYDWRTFLRAAIAMARCDAMRQRVEGNGCWGGC